ncbi:MAG: peptide ABC transporter substrate-binding protein [Pseudomonadota bacterium]
MRAYRLVILLALGLVGCGESESNPESTSSIVRGLSAAPESIDPQLARSVASAVVLTDLYEGLLTRNAEGQIIAGAAISWELSADERQYTFRLREGLRWSDGSALTAGDFVRGWTMLIADDTAAFYADLLNPVRRTSDGRLAVEASDDATLVVTLTAPTADFLERLAHPALAPRASGEARYNGAYQLEQYAPLGSITLLRNPYFHAADSVAIVRVEYQPFEQEQTEYAAFRSGTVDVTSRVPRAVFRQETRPDTLRTAPYLGVVYLSFNMRDAPSAVTRCQLSAAIDRKALTETIIGRGEQPAYGLIPPGVANGVLPFESRMQAVDGVDSASQPTGELTLHYATSDENRVVAAALQEMWRSAYPDLKVTLANKEFRVLLSESRAGTFDGMMRRSWVADYNDASQFLAILKSDAAANSSGFADARLDTLLAAIDSTTDPAQRERLLHAAEQLIAAQVPVIPLYFFVSKHLVARRVAGWQDNPLDVHPSRFLRLLDE